MSKKEKYLTRLVEECFNCTVTDYRVDGTYVMIKCTASDIKDGINIQVDHPYKSNKVRLKFYTWVGSYSKPGPFPGFTSKHIKAVRKFLPGTVKEPWEPYANCMAFVIESYPWK